MKCPVCGSWSSVITTRESPTFGHTRRRECGNEHRFTTQEVAISQEAIDDERRNHYEYMQKQLASVRAGKPKAVRKSNARIY
jgi:transcriptional regulator NrdR family protein